MQLLQPAVYVTLIAALWILGTAKVSTVLAASIVGSVATFIAGLNLVKVPIRGTRSRLGDLVRKGLHFSGSAVAETASIRADQIFALPLLGAYQAGIYSVAATIGAMPLAVAHALGASYFAPIAQAGGDRRKNLQSEAVRGAVAAAAMVIPPVAAATWVLIPIVFGDEFRPSVPVSMVSLVGSAGLLVAYVVSMALAADGRGLQMTIAQVASLLFGIGALLLLGPVLGAIGAAVASTLGYFLLLALLLVFLRIPYSSLWPDIIDFKVAVRRLRRD